MDFSEMLVKLKEGNKCIRKGLKREIYLDLKSGLILRKTNPRTIYTPTQVDMISAEDWEIVN